MNGVIKLESENFSKTEDAQRSLCSHPGFLPSMYNWEIYWSYFEWCLEINNTKSNVLHRVKDFNYYYFRTPESTHKNGYQAIFKILWELHEKLR